MRPEAAWTSMMVELLASNDVVLMSYVETLLKAAGIAYFLADTHMSLLEAQVGVMPRRMLVARADLVAARALLGAHDLAGELSSSQGHG